MAKHCEGCNQLLPDAELFPSVAHYQTADGEWLSEYVELCRHCEADPLYVPGMYEAVPRG